MNSSSKSARQIIQEAYQALQKGDRRNARRLAEQAAIDEAAAQAILDAAEQALHDEAQAAYDAIINAGAV